jgi:DNA-binding transcriptional ArsR family regulator
VTDARRPITERIFGLAVRTASTDLFKALADPTRRAIFERLSSYAEEFERLSEAFFAELESRFL